MKNNTVNSGKKNYKISYSLKRSNIRAKILIYLNSNNGTTGATMYEITRAVDSNYVNVKGALYGNNKGYSLDDSLLKLGLVSSTADNNRIIFRITQKGIEALSLIGEINDRN